MKSAAKNALTQEILTENIWRLMAKLSLPAIIAMSINSINTFVDALFVGQFIGQDALAAVSLVFPLTMITNGFSAMIGVGSSSLLSRAIGADDQEIQRKVFGTLTLLSIISAIILTSLGLYFARDLIAMMGGTGRILDLGTYYYQIMLLGTFFRIYSVALNMLIRAEGKIKEAMTYSIIVTLINIALNPLFIAYFGWGIAGAAGSTIVAMVLFTIMGLRYFLAGKNQLFD